MMEKLIEVGILVEIPDGAGTVFAQWHEARWKLPAGTKLYAAAQNAPAAPTERRSGVERRDPKTIESQWSAWHYVRGFNAPSNDFIERNPKNRRQETQSSKDCDCPPSECKAFDNCPRSKLYNEKTWVELKPVCYRYAFVSSVGGYTWRFNESLWNGVAPFSSEPLYNWESLAPLYARLRTMYLETLDWQERFRKLRDSFRLSSTEEENRLREELIQSEERYRVLTFKLNTLLGEVNDKPR